MGIGWSMSFSTRPTMAALEKMVTITVSNYPFRGRASDARRARHSPRRSRAFPQRAAVPRAMPFGAYVDDLPCPSRSATGPPDGLRQHGTATRKAGSRRSPPACPGPASSVAGERSGLRVQRANADKQEYCQKIGSHGGYALSSILPSPRGRDHLTIAPLNVLLMLSLCFLYGQSTKL